MRAARRVEILSFTIMALITFCMSAFSVYSIFYLTGIFYAVAITTVITTACLSLALISSAVDSWNMSKQKYQDKTNLRDICIAGSIVIVMVAMTSILYTEVEYEKDSGIICELPGQPVNREFEIYDSAKVSGSTVRSAIDYFDGRIAVIIRNAEMTDEDSYAMISGYLYCDIGLEDTEGDVQFIPKDVFNKVLSPIGNSLILSGEVSIGKNYSIKRDIYNTLDTPTYIKNSDRYLSRLIKDKAGAIVGIYFEEVGISDGLGV